MKLVLAVMTGAAAALLVVPGTAQAATAASPGRLAGTFLAAGTVTSSTYLERGQDVYPGYFRLTPTCANGTCPTTLSFAPVDIDVRLPLTPADGGYSGRTTVLENCVDNAHTLASHAYRTTYTARISVTRRTAGKATAVAGTMKRISTLTAAGRAAGCSSHYSLVYDFTGTAR